MKRIKHWCVRWSCNPFVKYDQWNAIYSRRASVVRNVRELLKPLIYQYITINNYTFMNFFTCSRTYLKAWPIYHQEFIKDYFFNKWHLFFLSILLNLLYNVLYINKCNFIFSLKYIISIFLFVKSNYLSNFL